MPSGRRWSFGVEIGGAGAWSGGAGPRAGQPAPAPGAPHTQRARGAAAARFETVADRKLRPRQLTEDGNVEIQRAGLADVKSQVLHTVASVSGCRRSRLTSEARVEAPSTVATGEPPPLVRARTQQA
jgi:hypothetical protein